ncbi:MAG: hypothetical protein QW617_03525 [Acidilobaceae archaeon]
MRERTLDLKDKLRLFLAEYGERGYAVLKAVLDEAKSSKLKVRLGDVSARGVRERLKLNGIEYNPIPLLTKLEKEVGLLETSYKSSSQRWWKVFGLEVLEEVLKEYVGEEQLQFDVSESMEARVFRLQLELVGLRDLARRVSIITNKGKLSSSDWSVLRKIVLEDLPALIKIKKDIESSMLTEEFQEELNLIESLIATIESVVRRERQRTRGLEQSLAYARELEQEEH